MSDENLSAPSHISVEEVASSRSAESSTASDGEKTLMKRTLVAQGKKIQQLTAKIDVLETEREAMRQQVKLMLLVAVGSMCVVVAFMRQ